MSPEALVLSAGTVQSTPFLERLAPARAAGFAGVSMFAADYDLLEAAGVPPTEIRVRVADAGLFVDEVEIVGAWLPGRDAKRLPGWLATLLDRNTPERLIAIAEAVGARGISVGELRGRTCDPDLAAERFAAICDAAHGLHVSLEFIPTGGLPDLASAWDVVRRASRGNGGLLVDSWHFFRSGSDLAQLADLPAGAITGIQISDAPAAPEPDLDHAMVHDRLLPGDGALDLVGFLAALRATGTTAPVGVEIFSDAIAALSIGEATRVCAASARRVLGVGSHV